MTKLDKSFELLRASDHFGELRRLPEISFRGISGSELAAQYRKVRALEELEPGLPSLLNTGATRAPWAEAKLAPLLGSRKPKPHKAR